MPDQEVVTLPKCSIRNFLLVDDKKIIHVDKYFIKWLGFGGEDPIKDFTEVVVKVFDEHYILNNNDCHMPKSDILQLLNNPDTPRGAEIRELISIIEKQFEKVKM